jgi:hypothetical protein
MPINHLGAAMEIVMPVMIQQILTLAKMENVMKFVPTDNSHKLGIVLYHKHVERINHYKIIMANVMHVMQLTPYMLPPVVNAKPSVPIVL